MADQRKTKAQLLEELNQLRSIVAKLQSSAGQPIVPGKFSTAPHRKHQAPDSHNVCEKAASDHGAQHQPQWLFPPDEKMFETVFNAVQDGISLLDADLTIRWVNDAMRHWYAASLPLEGKKCFQAYHHADQPCNPCPTLRCLQTGTMASEVVPGLPDSPAKWLELYSYPIHDSSGAIVGVVEFVRDITTRKLAEIALQKANAELSAREEELTALNEELTASLQQLKASEESLRESEERYRHFYQEVRDGCCAIDLQGKFTECNPAFERITGYTIDELQHMSYEDLTPAQWHEMERRILREQVAVQGYSSLYEKEYRHKDGHIFPIELQAYIRRDRDGNHIGYWAFVRDITERRKSEEERNRLLTAIAQSHDAIAIMSPTGVIEYANPAILSLLDRPFSEIMYKNPLFSSQNLVKEQNKKMIADIWQTLNAGEAWYGTVQEHKKDGTSIDLELSITPVKNITGRSICFILIGRDITERKKMQQQLERFAAAIEHAAETVMIMAADGTIQYVNPATQRLTGFTKAEVVGKNPFFTTQGIYSSDFYRSVWETLRSGSVWQGQMTNISKDGKRYELEAVISPIRDSNGGITGYISIGRDITRELALEQQLRQSQKMEAIGTLAGGIAHDFNNILSAIIGYTELACEQLPESEQLRHNLLQVLKAADRAKNLVQQILAFSRKSQMGHQPIPFAATITDALKLLRPTLPSTIEIHTHITDSDAAIRGDATQIQQVLINLCTNAAHAMQETGGTLTIAVNPVSLDLDQAALYNVGCGDYVMLEVTDTGTGISPDIIDRIFDPFFTTKEVGKGSGMGLAVVHGIVKSHGGGIRVESQTGNGTSFFAVFPRIYHTDPHEPVQEVFIPGGNESVLIVDDEDDLRTVSLHMLESLGYRVVAARTSIEALSLFLQDPERFDLVITDQTMPGMTGYELAKKILEVRPSMPIILCTGYSETVSEDKARACGITGFIFKPFNRAELGATVRTALDKSTCRH